MNAIAYQRNGEWLAIGRDIKEFPNLELAASDIDEDNARLKLAQVALEYEPIKICEKE